jgi:hypothetical protein
MLKTMLLNSWMIKLLTVGSMYAHATAVSKRRDTNLVSSLVEVLLLEL